MVRTRQRKADKELAGKGDFKYASTSKKEKTYSYILFRITNLKRYKVMRACIGQYVNDFIQYNKYFN